MVLSNVIVDVTIPHRAFARNGDVNNHIAEHHLKTKHQMTGTLRHV